MTASVMVVDPKPPSEPFLFSRAQDLTYKITLRSRALTERPLQQAKVVEETTGVHRHPGGVHHDDLNNHQGIPLKNCNTNVWKFRGGGGEREWLTILIV